MFFFNFVQEKHTNAHFEIRIKSLKLNCKCFLSVLFHWHLFCMPLYTPLHISPCCIVRISHFLFKPCSPGKKNQNKTVVCFVLPRMMVFFFFVLLHTLNFTLSCTQNGQHACEHFMFTYSDLCYFLLTLFSFLLKGEDTSCVYHVYTWCFKALGLHPVSRIINHSLLNIFGPVLHSNLSVIHASSVQSRNSIFF